MGFKCEHSGLVSDVCGELQAGGAAMKKSQVQYLVPIGGDRRLALEEWRPWEGVWCWSRSARKEGA